MKRLEITPWDKYWRLIVITEVERHISYSRYHRMFECECECWTIKAVRLNDLRTWKTLSCWCLNQEKRKSRKKHWDVGTRFYKQWWRIIARCTNPNETRYKDYGARGIWVCDKWLKYIWYKEDMYESYIKHTKKHWEKDTTIERTDNEKWYNIKNCCWATMQEQRENTRRSIKYKWKCLSMWCRELWLNYMTTYKRIKRGIPMSELLTK